MNGGQDGVVAGGFASKSAPISAPEPQKFAKTSFRTDGDPPDGGNESTRWKLL